MEKKVKLPLQSCIFCPSESGMAPNRSDDEPFFGQILANVKQTDHDEHKRMSEQWKNQYNRLYISNLAEKVADELDDLAVDNPRLRNTQRGNIEGYNQLINDILTNDNVSQGIKNSLQANLDTFNNELARRDDERNQRQEDRTATKNQQKQIDNERVRLENENERSR